MKARVKATGEIVDKTAMVSFQGDDFYLDELESLDDNPDYWTRLEHQAAIGAMQGILAKYGIEPLPDDLINDACEYAHALVEKLKEKEEK